MQTDAHNMGREERRAQRRAAVARQLRRLAIELTDLDRQLDEIEQSEGRGTPSALQGHTARTTAPAAGQVPRTATQVEDHLVAGRQCAYAIADRFDDASGFVSE